MSYNGWTNWATWNTFLWISNDEPMYRAAVGFARTTTEIDAKTARAFVEELMPSGTPDFRSEHHGRKQGSRWYDEVDWVEIATALEELRGG